MSANACSEPVADLQQIGNGVEVFQELNRFGEGMVNFAGRAQQRHHFCELSQDPRKTGARRPFGSPAKPLPKAQSRPFMVHYSFACDISQAEYHTFKPHCAAAGLTAVFSYARQSVAK